MLFGQLAGSSSWNPAQLRSVLGASGTCTATAARNQVGFLTAHFQTRSHCPVLPKENTAAGNLPGTECRRGYAQFLPQIMTDVRAYIISYRA